MTEVPESVTVLEAAVVLGWPYERVRLAVLSGAIPARRLPPRGRIRIPKSWLVRQRPT